MAITEGDATSHPAVAEIHKHIADLHKCMKGMETFRAKAMCQGHIDDAHTHFKSAIADVMAGEDILKGDGRKLERKDVGLLEFLGAVGIGSAIGIGIVELGTALARGTAAIVDRVRNFLMGRNQAIADAIAEIDKAGTAVLLASSYLRDLGTAGQELQSRSSAIWSDLLALEGDMKDLQSRINGAIDQVGGTDSGETSSDRRPLTAKRRPELLPAPKAPGAHHRYSRG